MFSSKGFTAWSEEHVLFLSVASGLANRKHDRLGSSLGLTGFPNFGFLDEGGGLLATLEGPRTLEGLRVMAKQAKRYADLCTRAAKGDTTAAHHLLVQDLILQRNSYTYGALRYAASKAAMSPQLRARAEQALTDLQCAEIWRELQHLMESKAITVETRKKRFAIAMEGFFRANRIPSGRYGLMALSGVMRSAFAKKDTELFEAALRRLKVFAAQMPRQTRRIEMHEKQLLELKKGGG